MRKHGFSTLCTFVILFAVSLQPVFGGIIPGRWEKVQALPSDTVVLVYLHSGQKIEGTIAGTDADSVTLVEIDHSRRLLHKADIARIRASAGTDDSGADGALKGLVAESISGCIAGALLGVYATDDGRPGARAAKFALGMGSAWGAVGTAIGFGIDKVHRAPEMLYIAK